MSGKASVAVFHTKMIIGGGERLLIDMAKALQSEGHRVTVFVNEHNRQKCFEETVDGTVEVQTVPVRLPDSVFGRLSHICFIVKFMVMVFKVLLTTRTKFDLVIVDEHPFVLPLVRLFRKRTIYYMHYPVKLVGETQRGGSWLVFKLLGVLEEISLLFASVVFVNSRFIQELYRKYFRVASRLGKVPRVLYPVGNYGSSPAASYDGHAEVPQLKDKPFFLSVNRFCPNKNLEVALNAFALLPKGKTGDAKLVFAGGLASEPKYTAYFEHFRRRVSELGLEDKVVVLPNISQKLLLFLYSRCLCVLYTPVNEHFGIIPIEAQSYNCVVLASNTGGPLETVGKESGFNLPDAPAAWAEKMEWVMDNEEAVGKMREEGPRHVERNFSFKVFQGEWSRAARSLLG